MPITEKAAEGAAPEANLAHRFEALAKRKTVFAGLIIFAAALATKRLAKLPYRWLFIGIVFFLPFPYYFLLAENDYVAILKAWLVVLAFSGEFRKRPALAHGASKEAEG